MGIRGRGGGRREWRQREGEVKTYKDTRERERERKGRGSEIITNFPIDTKNEISPTFIFHKLFKTMTYNQTQVQTSKRQYMPPHNEPH